MLLLLRFLLDNISTPTFVLCFNMASKIEEFVTVPSEDLLDDFSKDKLLELATHYKMYLSTQDKRLKDSIKTTIKTELFVCSILKSQLPTEAVIRDRSSMSRLTFEQQKQLLLTETQMKEKHRQNLFYCCNASYYFFARRSGFLLDFCLSAGI